jgi:hypothetical protein
LLRNYIDQFFLKTMNTRRTAAAVAAQRNQQGNLPNNRTDPDGLRVSTSFEGVSPPTSLMGSAALAVQDFIKAPMLSSSKLSNVQEFEKKWKKYKRDLSNNPQQRGKTFLECLHTRLIQEIAITKYGLENEDELSNVQARAWYEEKLNSAGLCTLSKKQVERITENEWIYPLKIAVMDRVG